MSKNEMLAKLELLNEWEKIIEEAKAEADSLKTKLKPKWTKETLTKWQLVLMWFATKPLATAALTAPHSRNTTLTFTKHSSNKQQAKGSLSLIEAENPKQSQTIDTRNNNKKFSC